LPASGLFLLVYLLLLLHKPDTSVRTVTAWPQTMFNQLQMPLSLLSADQPVPPLVCQKIFTLSHTDVDAKVLSYISASQTYVGDEGLAFWNSISTFLSLAPFTQHSLAAPASQAYVERVFNVCGYLTSEKINCLCKKLANRPFLKVNNKF